MPGVIYDLSREGLDIGTSKGLLRIKKIQLPGKKIIDQNSIFNSYRNLFENGQSFS